MDLGGSTLHYCMIVVGERMKLFPSPSKQTIYYTLGFCYLYYILIFLLHTLCSCVLFSFWMSKETVFSDAL